MAARSELVNSMELLITVSRLSPTMAVTITVKGEPARAVGGAVTLRVACVPQPNVINPAKAALNAPSRSAAGTVHALRWAGFPENLTSTGTQPSFESDNLFLN